MEKCIYCGGELKLKKVNKLGVKVEDGIDEWKIEKVPAYVCKDCGETVLDVEWFKELLRKKSEV